MKQSALIIGANSAVGTAIAEQLTTSYNVHQLSRANSDYSEQSLSHCAETLGEQGPFRFIVSCIGILHDEVVAPEKNLRQIDADKLAHYFYVNTILPTLCLKHFHRLLDNQSTAVFALLSAMVGSIGDNRLGGWYGYRSSKAALNMVIKTAAIEVGRGNKCACVVAIHPGTTISDLSAPYIKNVAANRLYTPQQSASRLIKVMSNIDANHSGSFLNWDGTVIPW